MGWAGASSGGRGAPCNEFVAHRGERVDAGRVRSAPEPVGGGEDPGGIGRPIPRREAQLDCLAGRIEADEMHPRTGAGADGDGLEIGGARQARMTGGDTTGELEGGAAGSVRL